MGLSSVPVCLTVPMPSERRTAYLISQKRSRILNETSRSPSQPKWSLVSLQHSASLSLSSIPYPIWTQSLEHHTSHWHSSMRKRPRAEQAQQDSSSSSSSLFSAAAPVRLSLAVAASGPLHATKPFHSQAHSARSTPSTRTLSTRPYSAEFSAPSSVQSTSAHQQPSMPS